LGLHEFTFFLVGSNPASGLRCYWGYSADTLLFFYWKTYCCRIINWRKNLLLKVFLLFF